ncbi:MULTISPECIES: GntR family transcriptional regulator [Yersiniaceae]|uniref:GntR family transcriptional regulator n=1 Tax=Yersiniaceae TaxID=1903411 RepID=UPI00093548FB|nr:MULTISPECIES: GntR family transcriptional regulator [Yersiniaceae]PLR32742.1 GntR family transcriptional regulator [Chimaeribacter arupi]
MSKGKNDLYNDLKRQILTMERDPDEALDEAGLSQCYHLSRTPVREVLRRLAGEGYIEIREKYGARVIPMSHASLRNFFLVAPMIYAATARLAVQNAKPAQLTALKETQRRFQKACLAGDAQALVLQNNRFHEIFGEMSANQYLEPSLRRLLIDHARIGHTFFRPKNSEMSRRLTLASEHHDAFIVAVEKQDENAAVNLVFEHWELSRETMEIFIAPQGLKADALVNGSDDYLERT